jgi:hypothetical protein
MTAIKLVLLVHGALSVALLGAAVHSGVLGVRRLLGHRVSRRLWRLYPRVVAGLYLPNLALGAWLYPAFRLDVRAAYLDRALPQATAAFEFKEHGVVLGLMALVAQVVLTSLPDRRWDAVAGAIGVFVATTVVYAGLTGLALVSLRSV